MKNPTPYLLKTNTPEKLKSDAEEFIRSLGLEISLGPISRNSEAKYQNLVNLMKRERVDEDYIQQFQERYDRLMKVYHH